MATTCSSSTSSNGGFTLKRSTPKNSVTAQDLLALQDTVKKFGLLRKKGKRLNLGKWPHRFVILTYDTLYIYANETSKFPNSKFSLAGYNKVARSEVKGQNWCFSIHPAVIVDCAAVKTFACVSDADRKDWMKAVRNQMHYANFIDKPRLTEKSMRIIDDDDYDYLEQLVYTASQSTIPLSQEDFDDDDGEDSNSSDSSQVFDAKSPKRTTTHDANDSGDSNGSYAPAYESYDQPKMFENPKRHPKDPQPNPHSSSSHYANDSSEQPPRYSRVMSQEDSSLYINESVIRGSITKSKQSLVDLCTIQDANPDRNRLVAMLQEKQESGTYLIRNSRNGDQKVLAYLSPTGHVKEYKILGEKNRPTLDREQIFDSLEELLIYYTREAQLPMSSTYLKRGIYDNITDS